MRKIIGIWMLLATLAGAQGLHKGDRVFVTSLKEYGTVTAVNGPRANLIDVILDKFHTTDPNQAITFDAMNVRAAPADAPPGPAAAAPPKEQATQKQQPGGDSSVGPRGIQPASASDADRQAIPNSAPANEETFKRLIRRNYAIMFPDNRVTTTFKTFDVAGPLQLQDDLSFLKNQINVLNKGRVHTGYKVHSHLTVLKSRTTPHDHDFLMTVDGHWRIYKNETGEWLSPADSGGAVAPWQQLP